MSNYASGGAATTIYVGGLLEKVTTSAGTDFRHLIRAGGSTIVVSRQSTGTNSTHYVTSDHLGSSSAITNSSGAILVNSSFDAFGKRRGSNWSGSPSSGDWSAIAATTRRGYTEHSMLDNLGLIHMNGRVHDPVVGRFLSADPYIAEPLNTQNYNRYSYVYNNPLSAIDPSGFLTGQECKNCIQPEESAMTEITVTGRLVRQALTSLGDMLREAERRASSASGTQGESAGGSGGGAEMSEELGEVVVCANCKPPLTPRYKPIDVKVPLNFGTGTIVGGALVGGAVGASEALSALALGHAAPGLIGTAAGVADVGALGVVGSTVGAAAGVALAGSFAIGYGIGTYLYNSATDWYFGP